MCGRVFSLSRRDGDSGSDGDEFGIICYKCKQGGEEGDERKWIGCVTCDNMAHKKCEHLGSLKVQEVKNTNWACSECIAMLKAYKALDMKKLFIDDFVKINEEIKARLEGVKIELEGMREGVVGVADTLTADAGLGSASSELWSEVVSRGAKRKEKKEKNLLVLKAKNENEKATDKKVEVSRTLEGVQIKDSKFTSKGDIVMNFENEATLNDAVQKLGNMANMMTKSVKKIKPKIMICNVHKEKTGVR